MEIMGYMKIDIHVHTIKTKQGDATTQ